MNAATPVEAGIASSPVEKACRILRVMGDARHGRLTDIATAARLDKATALRLLETLGREGFVVRDPTTKCYTLGREAFVLGLAAHARTDLRRRVRPGLLRLVASFQDTAILSIPAGIESVCVDLQLGSFPIRANYLDVGSRRPLGVGSGSLAILAWLSDDEIAAVLPYLADRLDRYPRFTPAFLEQQIALARRRGYVVLLDAVVERMGGVALPIRSADGRPIGALSIAALSERIDDRETALVAALRREVGLIEAGLRDGGG
ncbi:MAG: IclR family transcriptional regulator [Burkholderiales bacterium]|nr:IclR family transcriptional regulator [Burkholderiales bacterium]